MAGFEVETRREGPGQLALRYRLTGAIADLALPPPAPPARADGLWKHTCFEAFVSAGDEAYLEFNVAPSGEWAAYRFDAYRRGMVAPAIAAPTVEVELLGEQLELRAVLALSEPGPIRVGVSAVIEEAGGRLSYWSLAHPPGRPDFHHAAGRLLVL